MEGGVEGGREVFREEGSEVVESLGREGGRHHGVY